MLNIIYKVVEFKFNVFIFFKVVKPKIFKVRNENVFR